MVHILEKGSWRVVLILLVSICFDKINWGNACPEDTDAGT